MKIKLVGTPKDAPYLTPGKVYEAAESAVRGVATIVDDEGDVIDVFLPTSSCPCPHARPALWRAVE